MTAPADSAGLNFQTYDDAVRYIVESTDYERMKDVSYSARTFRLDRVRRLLEVLDNPHHHWQAVHIAGTKGKGSTAALVEAIARAHGLKCGLFTSPHLVDMRERIQIDRQWIDREVMRQLTQRLARAVEAHLPNNRPTFFEMLTAIGFMAFREAGCNLAVLEVGLGGRLDSTNVVLPQVAVITGISLDHTAQLGPDLASIAAEKAGIIKPGGPLVVAPQQPEAAQVIEARAAELGAPLVKVGREVTFHWQAELVEGRPAGRVTVETPRARYEAMELALPGRSQAINASCAVAACEILLEGMGRPLDEAALRQALRSVVWEGRMQTFPGQPTVILDGAHNAASLRQLLDSVDTYYPQAPRVTLFGSAADKDIAGMMAVLAERGERVHFTRTDNPRAADPQELRQSYAEATRLASSGGECIGASSDILAALNACRESLPPQGVLVICGSLYLVGEILGCRDYYRLQ